MARTSTLTLWITLLVGTLCAPEAQAKPFIQNGPFFLMTANCVGCPSGDAGIALNPAVIEYILADKESVARVHYALLRQWDMGTKEPTSTNPLIMVGMQQDLQIVYQNNTELIHGLTGGTDLTSSLHGDDDGVAFARGLGRYTAAAGNEMLAKKGWIQWMWGWRWEHDGEPPMFKTPTVNGVNMTLLAPHKAQNTIDLHIWGKDMVTTVGKAICTYDVSGVPGAWDAGATLSYDDVAKSIKRTEGPLAVDFDPTYGFITGVHAR